MNRSLLNIAAAAAVILSTSQSHALQVTVTETKTDPTEIVKIHSGPLNYTGLVYAGVVNLTVDGVPAYGFCIDPFHFSYPSSQSGLYDVIPLKDGPKSPGPMGADAAEKIALIYSYAYSLDAGGITAAHAAALQLAIWQIVAESKSPALDYHQVLLDAPYTTDYGAGVWVQMVSDVNTFKSSANYRGEANLVALKSVHADSGQDYLIPQSVPDGGATAILLALGSGAVLLFARKRS